MARRMASLAFSMGKPLIEHQLGLPPSARPQGRAEVGRELPAQLGDRQVDAELDLLAHLRRPRP